MAAKDLLSRVEAWERILRRLALENAVSVAGTLLMAGATLTEVREKTPEPHGAPEEPGASASACGSKRGDHGADPYRGGRNAARNSRARR